MREATLTAVLLALLGQGCIGSDEGSAAEILVSELEDECFASGRVVGLERGEDPCDLRLGMDTTGAWEQTLQGCEQGGTSWTGLFVDADAPEGTELLVKYRVLHDVIVPVGLPWITLDEPTAYLGAESGEFMDVRVELRKSEQGESPALHGVSVGRVCPL